ncbi:MFS transporter [Coccidioides immitis RS]|uniref:MFS transporter n=1 Tax=Coccidioides immitis (strain RS) TaxID=246410 RepID=J3KF70_COCIM|nr:MFS transporter [Coccidioides immitis RS]EAS34242.3 MFS transporter [Coccidioides immitis RS]
MDTKSASVEEVENPSLERHREKNVESSLEQTYIHAGLTPEVASFLANFSEERRKKCIRKIDWHLCPMLMVLYLCAYIDRANIGNAKIEGLLTDLKLSGTQYSFAVSIFFLPYVICEVPSNGIAMTLTGVVNNFGGLVATRLAVGIFEAGFFPGAVLLVSRCALSGAFSGLLAFAIAKMRGIGGYNGWRWIFIIEGLASIALSAFAFFALVDSPALSKRWLEPDEIRYLELRQRAQRGRVVVDEDPGKFDWSTLWQVVTDWQLYLQIINFWGNAVPNYGLKFTMPQIIKNMGYSSAKAQSLTVPPYMLGGLVTYVSSLLSDRFCVVIAFAVLFSKAENFKDNVAACYFAIMFACVGFYPITPGINAWTVDNLAGARKRAMGIAYMISIGNLGGIPGSFIYIEKEKPKYPTGFGSSFAFACAGIVATITLELAYIRINRRKTKMTLEEIH